MVLVVHFYNILWHIFNYHFIKEEKGRERKINLKKMYAKFKIIYEGHPENKFSAHPIEGRMCIEKLSVFVPANKEIISV